MEEEPNFGLFRNPITWGIVLTLFLGFLVYYLGSQLGTDGKPRYIEFLEGQPNTIGDTLAGIFAPLAFIWIVVTVFLQSHELREQRKELSFSREELKLAREAQEAQLQVMQKQADIFEDEKLARKEDHARRELDENLQKISTQIVDLTMWPLKWKYRFRENRGSPFDPSGSIMFLKPEELRTSRSYHRDFERWLRLLAARHEAAANSGDLIERCNSDSLVEIRQSTLCAIEIEGRLGSDQKIRLSVLRLHESVSGIDKLLGMDIWEPKPA